MFLTIGSGLVWLGAFFVWRLVGCRGEVRSILPVLLPVGAVIVMALVFGMTETISGLLWGTVVINLALIGVLGLCFGNQVAWRANLVALLWLGFGWLVCLFAGNRGQVGRFSGLGLALVGVFAVWQNVKTEKIAIGYVGGWRWWGQLFLSILLLLLGAWLLVWCQPIVAGVCNLPITIFSPVVLAPICGLTTLLGLRQYGKWQPARVWRGLLRGNSYLSTLGLGLIAVLLGGLHLTQSAVTVILPWAVGLAVLSNVVTLSSQKTARWWSGLMVVMYCAYLFSLLW